MSKIQPEFGNDQDVNSLITYNLEFPNRIFLYFYRKTLSKTFLELEGKQYRRSCFCTIFYESNFPALFPNLIRTEKNVGIFFFNRTETSRSNIVFPVTVLE